MKCEGEEEEEEEEEKQWCSSCLVRARTCGLFGGVSGLLWYLVLIHSGHYVNILWLRSLCNVFTILLIQFYEKF